MLVDLTVKEFLNKVVGSDPVPGGGSIAALNGAIASALAAMVANLTIGKKGYELHEELMRHISEVALRQKATFVEDIDRDSEAYDKVFACFKMPKATDEEKAARSAAIQEATKSVNIRLVAQKLKGSCVTLTHGFAVNQRTVGKLSVINYEL